jgi:hypothetical protein
LFRRFEDTFNRSRKRWEKIAAIKIQIESKRAARRWAAVGHSKFLPFINRVPGSRRLGVKARFRRPLNILLYVGQRPHRAINRDRVSSRGSCQPPVCRRPSPSLESEARCLIIHQASKPAN